MKGTGYGSSNKSGSSGKSAIKHGLVEKSTCETSPKARGMDTTGPDQKPMAQPKKKTSRGNTII